MVAHEVGPLAGVGQRRQRAQRLGDRRRLAAREGQVHRLVDREREQHLQLVAALAAEVGLELVRRQVHLAQQHLVALAPAREAAHLAQQVVRVAALLLRGGDPVRLDQERDGVDPEPAQPLLQPEAHDLRDRVAHRRVGDVQVRLVAVEVVQEVLPRLLVVGPDAVLGVGEDGLDVLRVRRRLVGPDVEVAVRRVAVRPRALEPLVLVRGVVHHQVGDHPHAPVVCRQHHLDQVARRPHRPVDAEVIDDVVPVVAVRRRVERHQPDARHADAGEVVHPVGQPHQVAAAVAVRVGERLRVQAVDHRVLPPQVGGALDHPSSSPGPRRTSIASSTPTRSSSPSSGPVRRSESVETTSSAPPVVA